MARNRFLGAGAGLVALFSIGAGVVAARKIKERIDQTPVASQVHFEAEVTLFYASNRSKNQFFGRAYLGANRSQDLKFGQYSKTLLEPVSLVEDAFEFNAFTHYQGQNDLIDDLKQVLANRSDKRVLIFIPGYGERFEKSMRRGCLLAAATTLPSLVFSWPSVNNFLAYTVDENNAEWSAAHLAELLWTLKQEIPAVQLIVVGFSLGSRIATWALQHLGAHAKLSADAPALLNHLILCSADMDPDIFALNAEIMARASEHTHVLASKQDVRLKLSSLLHGRSRLGDRSFHKPTGFHEPVARVRTIDFTALDPALLGHSIPHDLILRIINNQPLPEGLEAIDEGILEAEVT